MSNLYSTIQQSVLCTGGVPRACVTLKTDPATILAIQDIIKTLREIIQNPGKVTIGLSEKIGVLDMLNVEYHAWRALDVGRDELIQLSNQYTPTIVDDFFTSILSDLTDADLSRLEFLLSRGTYPDDESIEIIMPTEPFVHLQTVVTCYQDVFGKNAVTINKIHRLFSGFVRHVYESQMKVPTMANYIQDVASIPKVVTEQYENAVANSYNNIAKSDIPFYNIEHLIHEGVDN